VSAAIAASRAGRPEWAAAHRQEMQRPCQPGTPAVASPVRPHSGKGAGTARLRAPKRAKAKARDGQTTRRPACRACVGGLPESRHHCRKSGAGRPASPNSAGRTGLSRIRRHIPIPSGCGEFVCSFKIYGGYIYCLLAFTYCPPAFNVAARPVPLLSGGFVRGKSANSQQTRGKPKLR
jgi:hypothetical protein